MFSGGLFALGWGWVGGGGYVGGSFHGGIHHEGENFNEGGEGFSSTRFFTWKYRVELKLKTNIKYYVYKVVSLLHNTLLFTLKYF